MSTAYSLHKIVARLGGQIVDSGEHASELNNLTCVSSLQNAKSGSLSFFNDTKYTKQLENTQASVVVMHSQYQHLTMLPKILTDNPYVYFAKLSDLLNPKLTYITGVHTSAVIHESARIPQSCSIAAQVFIDENVVLGECVVIEAGCVIEYGVNIADNTRLQPNVTIKHGCKIGHDCTIYSGAVIGTEGFGYAEDGATGDKSWVKIPQVGNVVIGNHVDIGANTTIDRGALDDTIIEDGVKLDNLIQIGHNCHIGAHTVITGCVGIAGSAKIGRNCKIGGAAMILGHLTIADNVTISPGSMISRSIVKSGTYTALMPFQAHQDWLKTAANIRQLSNLAERVKILEKTLDLRLAALEKLEFK